AAGPQNERLSVAPAPAPSMLPAPGPNPVGGIGVSPLLNNNGRPEADLSVGNLRTSPPAPPAPDALAGMDRATPLPPAGSNSTPSSDADAGARVVAWSSNTDPGLPANSLPGTTTARGTLPNVMVVNDPQLSLEYEVKCGPSGVSKVELFLTEDDGKTW